MTATTPLALVTGASSGLGVHYATEFAARGHDLVITARRVEELESLAAQLRRRHDCTVTVLPADLGDPESRRRLVGAVQAVGQVDVLVNNAGFGTKGAFVEIDADRVTQEVQLNVLALTELTRAFLPGMVQRRRGTVVNISSTAAFQPLPTMAVYAATKAYVLALGQALWEEVRGSGVDVVTVCPGPTETEFFAAAGDASMMGRRRTAEQVIATTFAALDRHSPVAVDGAANNVLAQVSSRLPGRLVMRMTDRFLR